MAAFQKEEVDSSYPPPQFCPSPRTFSGAGLMHPHPAHSSLSQERNVHRITPTQCGAHLVFFGSKQVGSQPLLAAARFSAPRRCQAKFAPNALLYVSDAFGDKIGPISSKQRNRGTCLVHIVAWQDSLVWTATHIGNLLLSAHHKVAFDLCAFGRQNRRRGCFVSSSNVLAADITGHEQASSHLPPAFVDVFTAAVASQASSPFLVTRVACA